MQYLSVDCIDCHIQPVGVAHLEHTVIACDNRCTGHGVADTEREVHLGHIGGSGFTPVVHCREAVAICGLCGRNIDGAQLIGSEAGHLDVITVQIVALMLKVEFRAGCDVAEIVNEEHKLGHGYAPHGETSGTVK